MERISEDAAVLRALRSVPHLAALPADLLEAIAATGRVRTLRAGEPIFAQGDRARAFYAVMSGAVRVYRLSPDGREQVVHQLRPGATFGEPALLGARVYPAHAAASGGSAQVVEIPGESFLRLFHGDARLSAALVGALCTRLLELIGRVEELSTIGAEARLARHLLALPARRGAAGTEIALPVPKKEIAARLAISPETLSRLLKRWRDLGLVESRGRVLQVLDPERLIAIADREEPHPPEPEEAART